MRKCIVCGKPTIKGRLLCAKCYSDVKQPDTIKKEGKQI